MAGFIYDGGLPLGLWLDTPSPCADVMRLDSLYARVRDAFGRLFANAGIPGATLPVEKTC
jgi:hypothetical protein